MPVSRPELCILSLSPIHQDGRVLCEIKYAARAYDVTAVGWGRLDKERPHVAIVGAVFCCGAQMEFGGGIEAVYEACERKHWKIDSRIAPVDDYPV